MSATQHRGVCKVYVFFPPAAVLYFSVLLRLLQKPQTEQQVYHLLNILHCLTVGLCHGQNDMNAMMTPPTMSRHKAFKKCKQTSSLVFCQSHFWYIQEPLEISESDNYAFFSGFRLKKWAVNAGHFKINWYFILLVGLGFRPFNYREHEKT